MLEMPLMSRATPRRPESAAPEGELLMTRSRIDGVGLGDDPREELLKPIDGRGGRSKRRQGIGGGRWRMRVLLIALAFLGGVYASKIERVQAALGGPSGFVGPVDDVYTAIKYGYVDETKAEDLQRGAIDGMLEALDDDYAEYIPPTDKADFEKALTGQYSGIGCEVEIRDGWLTVVSPMEDSPALAAGVMANDRIIKIGDTTTYKLSVDECIKLLVGTEGTEVQFTVLRDGTEIPFSVKRARIVSKSVRGVTRFNGTGTDARQGHWSYIIDPAKRIAYIRISQFTPTTGPELAAAINEAQDAAGDEGLAGIIMDLRENPGGALEAALDVSDMFLKEGVIVSIRGRNRPPEVLSVMDEDSVGDVPLLVMVDGASASASEIVSGALQDHKRAVVLGSRTFGKGLVQTVLPLSHQRNGQVKFTTAKYYLPNGRLIQREDESLEWGVDPDPGFYVPETDDQLIDRFTRRRELDVLRRQAATGNAEAVTERWNDPVWVESEAKDIQLAAALRTMHGRVESGEFKAISDAKSQHGKIAVRELHDLRKVEKLTVMELARLNKRRVALEKSAEIGEAPRETPDLWPDDLKLTDGTVEVKDKDGKVIATLRITGKDLERWIANADVEPVKADEAKNAANTTEGVTGATSETANATPPAGQSEPEGAKKDEAKSEAEPAHAPKSDSAEKPEAPKSEQDSPSAPVSGSDPTPNAEPGR